MSKTLPPLPRRFTWDLVDRNEVDLFTAEQMKAYALAAIEADTELADLRQACREGWRHAAELEEERKRLQAEIDRVQSTSRHQGALL